MLTLEEVREKMNGADVNIKDIERHTGITYQTLMKVKHNFNPKMRYEVIKAISDYLEQRVEK